MNRSRTNVSVETRTRVNSGLLFTVRSFADYPVVLFLQLVRSKEEHNHLRLVPAASNTLTTSLPFLIPPEPVRHLRVHPLTSTKVISILLQRKNIMYPPGCQEHLDCRIMEIIGILKQTEISCNERR